MTQRSPRGTRRQEGSGCSTVMPSLSVFGRARSLTVPDPVTRPWLQEGRRTSQSRLGAAWSRLHRHYARRVLARDAGHAGGGRREDRRWTTSSASGIARAGRPSRRRRRRYRRTGAKVRTYSERSLPQGRDPRQSARTTLRVPRHFLVHASPHMSNTHGAVSLPWAPDNRGETQGSTGGKGMTGVKSVPPA